VSSLLSLRNIGKSFGGLSALSDISFDVQPGEIVGVIGPNGAGKTTLFNVVTAVFPPTAGEVLFDGKRISGLPPHSITKRGITRTFQNIRLFTTMTVEENVMVGRHCRTGAGVWRGVLRTRGQRREEREGKRGNCSTSWVCPEPTGIGPRGASPTATSGGSRSPGRWRPSRACCCSTSRWRG
jgi:ABC-type branched-chain amino acid transport systems, ATPase component